METLNEGLEADLRPLDDVPLEELLKPLSAKVMPRAARFSNGGHELEPEQQAAKAQRSINIKTVRAIQARLARLG